MPMQSHDFIDCPSCKQKLPPMAARCHFCGSDLKGVVRPAAPAKKVYKEFETPQWIKNLYVALCLWWMIGGVIQIFEQIHEVNTRKPDAFGITQLGWGPTDYLGLVFGAIGIIAGIGMLLKVKIIRKYVNIIAGLNILFGLLGLIGSLASTMLFGAIGLLFALANVLDIVVAALTIWLLGETSEWDEY